MLEYLQGLQEQVWIQVIFLIVLIIPALYYYWLCYVKPRSGRLIMLMGCCNSGKTALFSNLLYDKFSETFTSIKENAGFYRKSKCNLRLVDIPGHERLRQKAFDEFKWKCSGLVFMIDSATIGRDLRDVAELLHVILTDEGIRSGCRHVVIACNKQDLPLAKSKGVIQNMLEKELNVLRDLKKKELDSISKDEGKGKLFLGNKKKDFDFGQLNWLKSFQVIECVSHGKSKAEMRVDDLQKWFLNF